jgi:hypothetical protein
MEIHGNRIKIEQAHIREQSVGQISASNSNSFIRPNPHHLQIKF